MTTRASVPKYAKCASACVRARVFCTDLEIGIPCRRDRVLDHLRLERLRSD